MTGDTTPIRVEKKPCCSDCENPVHRLLAAVKPRLTEREYQRLLRALEREGIR